MQLSRRQFLQFTGITLLGSAIPPLTPLATPTTEATYGRTLTAAAVYAKPQPDAKVISQLWPDSIINLKAAYPGWYALESGFVPQKLLQPMQPYNPQPTPTQLAPPFWAEVAAPVAPLRGWCAAEAPTITRIGHGGVSQVIDILPDARRAGDWYGLANSDGKLLGWSQAIFWRPIQAIDAARLPLQLEINREQYTLNIKAAGKSILEAPIAIGSDLQAGDYILTKGTMGTVSNQAGITYHGVPWSFEFAGNSLSGVYWHNDFGHSVPGPAIQVTPVLAQWLYQNLADETQMSIR